MGQIGAEQVKKYLARGTKTTLGLAREILGDSINTIGDHIFAEGIEIGIMHTIAALYEANVSDNEICSLLNKYWGIGCEEATERLIWEKQIALCRELKQYLKMQGMTDLDIQNFIKENKVQQKLRHKPELWQLRYNPAKLLDVVAEDT